MMKTDAEPEVADAAIVFPDGLVGCETWKRFVLLTVDDEDLPVATLQSLDEQGVALLVTDPRIVLGDYQVPVSQDDRVELGFGEGTEPVLYCTLTIGSDGWLTANMLGPLVINPVTRLGKQLVISNSPYSARHPVARMGAEDRG